MWVSYHSPCFSNGVCAEMFGVASEAFVEPEIVPPLGCDQIAEPHVRDLVGEDAHDVLFGCLVALSVE